MATGATSLRGMRQRGLGERSLVVLAKASPNASAARTAPSGKTFDEFFYPLAAEERAGKRA